MTRFAFGAKCGKPWLAASAAYRLASPAASASAAAPDARGHVAEEIAASPSRHSVRRIDGSGVLIRVGHSLVTASSRFRIVLHTAA